MMISVRLRESFRIIKMQFSFLLRLISTFRQDTNNNKQSESFADENLANSKASKAKQSKAAVNNKVIKSVSRQV